MGSFGKGFERGKRRLRNFGRMKLKDFVGRREPEIVLDDERKRETPESSG